MSKLKRKLKQLGVDIKDRSTFILGWESRERLSPKFSQDEVDMIRGLTHGEIDPICYRQEIMKVADEMEKGIPEGE